MVVIAATLAGGLFACLSFWSDAADDANRAAADTRSARTLVAHIRALRPAAASAGSAGSLGSRLPRLIDTAIDAAGIDAEKQLTHITPQPPRRLEQGDLNEVPVQLVFHELSIRQILSFLTALTAGTPELTVRTIHLSYDSDWNMEITVSYLAPGRPGDGGS